MTSNPLGMPVSPSLLVFTELTRDKIISKASFRSKVEIEHVHRQSREHSQATAPQMQDQGLDTGSPRGAAKGTIRTVD